MWILMLLIGCGLTVWAVPKIRRVGLSMFARAVGVLLVDIWKAVARLFENDEHRKHHSKDDYSAVDAMEDLRFAREAQIQSEEWSRFDSDSQS